MDRQGISRISFFLKATERNPKHVATGRKGNGPCFLQKQKAPFTPGPGRKAASILRKPPYVLGLGNIPPPTDRTLSGAPEHQQHLAPWPLQATPPGGLLRVPLSTSHRPPGSVSTPGSSWPFPTTHFCPCWNLISHPRQWLSL